MTSRQTVIYSHFDMEDFFTQDWIIEQLRRMTISAVRSALNTINDLPSTASPLYLVEAEYSQDPGKLFTDHPDLSDSVPIGIILTSNQRFVARNPPVGLYAASTSQQQTKTGLKESMVEQFQVVSNDGRSTIPIELDLPIGKTWVSMVSPTVWWAVYSKENLSLEFVPGHWVFESDISPGSSSAPWD
ncbi:hypothetical protein M231_04229 [Tremella mesenterica]|uniref:Uncharacterized protein n=1 Tax=Tremella mesenterica TaxID=5217 RepID=A0A4Q1BL32_TREME|nr:hypothetical protein M231_04229 [Tremella mesenterica]